VALRTTRPKIRVDRGLHDFGHHKQNLTLREKFRITNDGDAILKLTDVQVSCHCTKAVLSQTELPPSAEGQLDLTLETGVSVGIFNYTVTISTNDPKQPQVKLGPAGRGARSVDFYPELLNFGKVAAGATKILTLAVRHPDGKPFALRAAVCSHPEFTVLSIKPATETRTAYFIEVQGLARAGEKTVAGFLLAMLTIQTDLDQGTPTQVKLILQVEGAAEGPPGKH